MNGIILPLAAFMLALFLILIFNSKKNIDNFETKIYSRILILNFLYAFLAVFAYLIAKMNGNEFVIGLLQKLYMSNMLSILMYMLLYNIEIVNFSKKTNLILIRIVYIFTSVIIFLSFIFPIHVINDGEILDGYGLSYDIILSGTIIYFFLIIVSSIKIFVNNKNNLKKDVPFLLLIFLFLIGLVLRKYFPSVMFENFFLLLYIINNVFHNRKPRYKNDRTIKYC